jgi:predicted AAA+ superfamily ATPase
MTEILIREEYIKKITPFIEKPVIKVITGIRRAGKSFFIKQLIDFIQKKGISLSNVLYINKELLEFDFINNYQDLYNYVENYFEGTTNLKYIFIDEIQEITEWEKLSVLFSHRKGTTYTYQAQIPTFFHQK